MIERYILVTDDEYVYFLDTEDENYMTLEDFEKKEFTQAKKDGINIEEYEDAILASAHDKYWEWVYEYHIDCDKVISILNEYDDYIDYLEKQNERQKERITELASNDKIVFMVNE